MLPSSWNNSPMRMLISVGHGAYCALSTGANKLDTGAEECFDKDCACAISIFAGTGSVWGKLQDLVKMLRMKYLSQTSQYPLMIFLLGRSFLPTPSVLLPVASLTLALSSPNPPPPSSSPLVSCTLLDAGRPLSLDLTSLG